MSYLMATLELETMALVHLSLDESLLLALRDPTEM